MHDLQKREADIKAENKAKCLSLSIALILSLKTLGIINQKRLEKVKLEEGGEIEEGYKK